MMDTVSRERESTRNRAINIPIPAIQSETLLIMGYAPFVKKDSSLLSLGALTVNIPSSTSSKNHWVARSPMNARRSADTKRNAITNHRDSVNFCISCPPANIVFVGVVGTVCGFPFGGQNIGEVGEIGETHFLDQARKGFLVGEQFGKYNVHA